MHTVFLHSVFEYGFLEAYFTPPGIPGSLFSPPGILPSTSSET